MQLLRARTIAPLEFRDAFLTAYEEWYSVEKLSSAVGAKVWTRHMLGCKEGRRGGRHGILGRAASRILPSPKITAEDYRVDQIWWYYWNPREPRAEPTGKEDWNTDAWYAAVAVEHENRGNTSILKYMLRKLFVVRSCLKVVMLYPFATGTPRRKHTRAFLLRESQSCMAQEAPDAEESSYLLCFGPDGTAGYSAAEWVFFAWSGLGRGWIPI